MRFLISSAVFLTLASGSAMATGKPQTPPTTPPANHYTADISATAVAAAAAQARAAAAANATGGNATGGTAIGNGGAGGAGGGGGVGYGGTGVGGQGGQGGTASTGPISINNSQKQVRQAPAIAASFSSVSGNPCERAPFGLGASGPGFGGLFQIPLESGNCWAERQAILLNSLGMRNAAIAVIAGNSPAVAIANNPMYVAQPVYRAKVKRTVRKSRAKCAC